VQGGNSAFECNSSAALTRVKGCPSNESLDIIIRQHAHSDDYARLQVDSLAHAGTVDPFHNRRAPATDITGQFPNSGLVGILYAHSHHQNEKAFFTNSSCQCKPGGKRSMERKAYIL
jgi:hypothetical protein